MIFRFILLLALFGCQLTAQAQPLDPGAFYALTSPQARMAFLRQDFAPADKAAYMKLLPYIQVKKDRLSELYWYYRYYILADSFGMNIEEQIAQLTVFQQKAIANNDKIAKIVADVNFLILKHRKKEISTIELYKYVTPCIEEMRKIGFENFVHYDLNFMISYCMADLSSYWGSQPENSRKYLKIAEQYISNSKISKHYQNIVFYQLRDCDLQDRRMQGCNDYSWKIYYLNHAQNPDLNPAEWRTAYWQVVAISQLAILHYIEKQYPESHQYAKQALAMYKKLNIKGYHRDKAFVERYILDDLTISLIALGYLSDVPPLLARFDSILVKFREEGRTVEESEWGLWRDREEYYEKIGEYKLALQARRRADAYYLQLYDRNSKHELDRVREEHRVETYVDQVRAAKAEKQLQEYISLSVVVLMVLFAALAYAVYRRISRDKKLITNQKMILEGALIEKETLIKEVHHRVKNNLQIISGLLEKQAQKISDDTTKRLLKEGQNRVFSMALVHQNLYQSDNLSAVDIQQYFVSLISNIQKSQQLVNQKIELKTNIADVSMNVDMAIPLGLILNELLTNCYKYAFVGRDAGSISISFQPNADNGYAFVVADNGNGISPTVDWRKSRSLGLNLVNGLVRQLSGQLEVQSAPETGTKVQMQIPTTVQG